MAFAAIAITRAIGPISGYAKAVAAVAFLYLPGMIVWRRNEDYRDYGATLGGWKRGAALGVGFSAIVLPLFVLGFFGFVHLLQNVPEGLSGLLAPYPKGTAFHFRLPDRFPAHLVDQFLVVALPEELFYRGFMQQRLRDAWPKGRTFLGARLGPAFWVTAALFAVGHLAEPHPWRLGVFFPALVFGWMRERTGTIVPGVLFHALSNLTVLVLEASFFGPR
ncbi:MAG: CPBP family intramembrane metalloprotease [Deltaproteobacteria bacterium]|nr:CPBP family intramembrane metalloprotease [Deltaproteobacteria bacterium]